MNERQAQYLQLLGIQAWCKQEDLPRIREFKKKQHQKTESALASMLDSAHTEVSDSLLGALNSVGTSSIDLQTEMGVPVVREHNRSHDSLSHQLHDIVGNGSRTSPLVTKPQPVETTKVNPSQFQETSFQFSQAQTIFEAGFLQAIQNCQGCSFAQSRLQAVLPRQQSSANVMIITDIPLKEESRQGLVLDQADEPFFFKAMNQVGLTLENLYITPFIKCRPPELRDVEEKEWEACAPILYREIEAVKPQIIFILGRTSVKYLLKKELPFESLRQTIHSLTIGDTSYPVVISHSPRVYAKNPRLKSNFWQDLKYLRQHIQQSLS